MSATPRNKKIAALLTGASLLTLVGVSRASAVTQLITGAQAGPVFVTPGNDRVIVGPTANVTGDVINNVTIGNGNDPNPVFISSGAVITGAFVNNGTSTQTIQSTATAAIAAAAGIIDTAVGVPVIENNGLITADATANGSDFCGGWRCGCRAGRTCCGHGVRHGKQRRLHCGHCKTPMHVGTALAGAAGVIQAQLVLGNGNQLVDNDGTINGHATARTSQAAARAIDGRRHWHRCLAGPARHRQC